jgi:type IX secretion system substrate protein/disaggregatase-related protein
MKKHLLLGYFCASSALAFAQTTTLTLQPGPTDGKDAEVFSCVPCGYDVRNFGNKKDFDAIAWTNNGDESNVRSLIQFNLSSIPSNATVTDARLSLYNNPTSDEGGHVTSFFHPNKSVLQRIVSNWSESTVTWNTQPNVSSLNKVTLAATTSSHQNFLNINVTALVRDMIALPGTSFGFRLKLTSEDHFKKLIFASSDNTNAALRPKLVITYTVPSPRLENPGYSNLKVDQPINSITSFDISPNPAKDFLNVSIYANGNNPAALKIYNVIGKEIYNRTLQLEDGLNPLFLQTESWVKGIYFITIKTSKEVVTKKLIVE